MTDAFLVDGVRTLIGRYAGALEEIRPDDLAARVISALCQRHPSVDWSAVDDVVIGCANQAGEAPVGKLCSHLVDSPQSPVRRYTPVGADLDAVFDVRAVFQQSHHQLAITAMPELLFPHKGRYGLRDYEKAFCALDDANHAGANQNIYTLRRIDREGGCLVVVRPDQYIAHILPLGDTEALAAFFGGFMLDAKAHHAV